MTTQHHEPTLPRWVQLGIEATQSRRSARRHTLFYGSMLLILAPYCLWGGDPHPAWMWVITALVAVQAMWSTVAIVYLDRCGAWDRLAASNAAAGD